MMYKGNEHDPMEFGKIGEANGNGWGQINGWDHEKHANYLHEDSPEVYNRPIIQPQDHPIWAEAYWAYTLFTLIQGKVKDKDQIPMLTGEGCYRMLKGHGQDLKKEQVEMVMESLCIGDRYEPPEEEPSGMMAKLKKKVTKKPEKKHLDFVDFIAIFMVWCYNGRCMSRLHYYKRLLFYDISADWMLSRILWMGIYLTAFYAIPFSFVYTWYQDMASEFSADGWDEALAEAVLIFLFVVPYFLIFGTLGWFMFPGMKKWMAIGPLAAAGLAIGVGLQAMIESRTPDQFEDEYDAAVVAMNVITVISMIGLLFAVAVFVCSGLNLNIPRLNTEFYWQKRADTNREYVNYTMQRLKDGVHKSEKPSHQKFTASLKELMTYLICTKSQPDRSKSPIFLSSFLAMGALIMFGTTIITCTAFFGYAKNRQDDLYEVYNNMTAQFNTSSSAIQETADKYNVSTSTVEGIMNDLINNSPASTTLRMANYIEDLAETLLWSSYPCIIICLFTILLQVPFIMISYVTLLRKLRTLQWPVNWAQVNITKAGTFVGNAYAVALTGAIILTFCLTVFILCFTWSWLFDIWWPYRAYVFTWLVAYCIQTVTIHMIILKGCLSFGGWLEKYPITYSAIAYLDSSFSLITALSAGVFRLLWLVCLSCLWFVRMDYCMFPKGPAQKFDAVWKSWYASAIRYEITSNPFIDVFRDILCQQALGLFGTEGQTGARRVPAPDQEDQVYLLEAPELVQVRQGLLDQYPWLWQYTAEARLPGSWQTDELPPAHRGPQGTPFDTPSNTPAVPPYAPAPYASY